MVLKNSIELKKTTRNLLKKTDDYCKSIVIVREITMLESSFAILILIKIFQIQLHYDCNSEK